MVKYLIELKMADKNLAISEEMEKIIAQCTQEANETTVSIRNKRLFTLEKRIDEYTLVVGIQSKTAINPTRTLSTLTRAVSRNARMTEILSNVNHIINGCIFNSRLLSEEGSQILHLSDPAIVSEIVNIFFGNEFTPKEKEIVESTATEIRELVLSYKNTLANLK